MRHLGCPLQRVGVEGEAVVLGGYLHFARGEIHHRLIPSMMAKLELIALSSQRQAHDLMAKTNSKDWLFPDQFLHDFSRVRNRIRIPRAVGKKNAVRIQRQDLLCGGPGRHDSDLTPGLGKASKDIELDAVVICDHGKEWSGKTGNFGASFLPPACRLSFFIPLSQLPSPLIPVVGLLAGDVFYP